MSERGFPIDERAVLERRNHRLNLPTEQTLLQFIAENDGTDDFTGLKEKWETGKEPAILPYFERWCVQNLAAGDLDRLETSRKMIKYLSDRRRSSEAPRQNDRDIIDKIGKIRDYQLELIQPSDRELASEIKDEFTAEIALFSSSNETDPILRRVEKFIADAGRDLDEMGTIGKQEGKKRKKADRLWHLQLFARAVRDELLTRLFETSEN